ncbi:unnamed protein product [Agarophyton chilense]|eukprot:gb/GEZJ01007740.1/.p2 GENE.gb/GEZJ01007740.1/~~gb/GEZJ01007740.1/.p2  ORF type:complete len:114 (-),score=15.02 gb/GEZJ01007740.1/:532-873(-)
MGRILQTLDGVLTLHNIDSTHGTIDPDFLHFTFVDIFIDATENNNDNTNIVHPDYLFMATLLFIKNTKTLPESDQEKLSAAKREELKFLLKITVRPFLPQQVPNDCDSDGFYP